MIKIFTFFTGLISLSFIYLNKAEAQNLEKINFSYQYEVRPELKFNYLLQEDQQGNVGLTLDLDFLLNSDLKDFKIAFAWSDVLAVDKQSFQFISKESFKNISKRNYQSQLHFSKDQVKKYCIIFAENQKSYRTYYFDIYKETDPRLPSPNLVAVDNQTTKKIVNGYFPIDSEIVFKKYTFQDSVSNENHPIYVSYYNRSFNVSAPPMSTGSKVERKMEADSSFTINTNDIVKFEKEGLYLMQLDSTSQANLTLRLTNSRYPKLAKIEELIESLVYISTAQQYKEMMMSDEKRFAFESFWLSLFGSKESAKIHIKNYYRRIRIANDFFTDYKPGWKNDKGMIFIIFGPPNQVQKIGDQEIWTYRKTSYLSKQKFVFKRIKKPLSKKPLALQRNRDYTNSWYRAVGLWRKGKNKGI